MYRILLATRSPLYAPIYHAWVSAPRTFKERIALDFAVEGKNGDDLVSQTLAHCESNSVIMAVGDLTRLTNYIDQPGYDKPVILGGLIDKMCLWLATGVHDKHGARWCSERVPSDPKHHLILSHPDHMTTYHVIRHYLRNTARWDDELIDKHIFPVVDPGFERQYFKVWERQKADHCSLAYMTSEIPHRELGESDIIGFWSESEFQDVSMTGIFASETLFPDAEEDIRYFCGKIKESIGLLMFDGDRVPYDLYSSMELIRQTGLYPDHRYLCRLRRMLVRISAYSTNLALSRKQLEAMLKIKSLKDHDVSLELDKLVGCMKRDIPDAEPRAVKLSRRLRGVLLDRECVRRRLLDHTGPIKRGPLRFERRIFLRWFYLLLAVTLVYADDKLVIWGDGYVASHFVFMVAASVLLAAVVVTDALYLLKRSNEMPFFSFVLMAVSVSLLLYVFSYLWPGTVFDGDDLFVAVMGALVSGAYLLSKGITDAVTSLLKNVRARWAAARRAKLRLKANQDKLTSVVNA